MKKFVFALLALILAAQGCTAQVQQPSAPIAVEATAAIESAQAATAPSTMSAAPSTQSTSPSPSPAQASPEQISATGVYQGQADNNFIEIKIAGQPEDKAYMVFMLTGEIKANFESMGLKTGDTVQIRYFENSYGQRVLTELIKPAK